MSLSRWAIDLSGCVPGRFPVLVSPDREAARSIAKWCVYCASILASRMEAGIRAAYPELVYSYPRPYIDRTVTRLRSNI